MRRASWQARHVMPRVRCGQEPSRSRAARRHCSRTGFAAATAVAPDILEIDTKEAIATIRSLAVLTFAPVTNGARAARSEERRVGKECRSRWSRDHEKKKEGEKMI